MTEEQWLLALQKPELVFARTSPTQKLEIVQRLQKLGNIVCVTGDGRLCNLNTCVYQ